MRIKTSFLACLVIATLLLLGRWKSGGLPNEADRDESCDPKFVILAEDAPVQGGMVQFSLAVVVANSNSLSTQEISRLRATIPESSKILSILDEQISIEGSSTAALTSELKRELGRVAILDVVVYDVARAFGTGRR